MAQLKLSAIFVQSLMSFNVKGPFVVSVLRDGNGRYTALSGGLVDKPGTEILGVDDYLQQARYGANREAFLEALNRHLDNGGILSFVKPGGHINDATRTAADIVKDHKKNVLFTHNDKVITVTPDMAPDVHELPGFYKS